MAINQFSELIIEPESNTDIKKRYSVTGDILQFQLCRRQYGFFAVRGYKPANLTQFWYGTVIHQVLDKLHLQFHGRFNPKLKGVIPTDEHVEEFFKLVIEDLRTQGIKAINDDIKKAALKVLKIFNRVEGPTLYPYVEDTECSLESDYGNYILHGKVDLIKVVSPGRRNSNFDAVEIWDYKGSDYPEEGEHGEIRLNQYIDQMLAYASLYKAREGKYPLKCILYFLNELNTDPEPTIRPGRVTLEIDFRIPTFRNKIDESIEAFSKVVEDIDYHKENDSWDAPDKILDKKTCDICDIRWDCPLNEDKYPMRYP